jgi:hypothetical protein
MRVILNLDKAILDDLQKMADAEKRSRKNFMELTLINAASGNNPILAIQDLTKPSNMITPITDIKPNVNIVEKVEAQPLSSIVANFDVLRKNILACQTLPEIEIVNKKIKSSLLNWKQKLELEEIAKKHSSTMYKD